MLCRAWGLFVQGSVPFQEHRILLQHPGKGSPVSKGKEEFIEEANTEDAEPIKNHEFFQIQQNYGERWKRKPAV